MASRTMDGTAWALLIGLSLAWGQAFFLTEVALIGFAPLTSVAGRLGVAALVLMVVVHGTGRRLPRTWRTWGALLVMGALNNAIPFSLITWGQSHIEGGVAAILNATTPIFVVVLAHMLTTDEKLTTARVAGVVLGFIGVAVMFGGNVSVEGLGQAAVLLGAMSYACAGIYGRRFAGIDTTVTAAGMLICSTALMLPLVIWAEGPIDSNPPPIAMLGLLANGVVGTAVAYVLYFALLKRAGATNLLLSTFLIPVSAIALGVAFLGERPGPEALLGMGVIFTGLVVIDGRLPRRLVAGLRCCAGLRPAGVADMTATGERPRPLP